MLDRIDLLKKLKEGKTFELKENKMKMYKVQWRLRQVEHKIKIPVVNDTTNDEKLQRMKDIWMRYSGLSNKNHVPGVHNKVRSSYENLNKPL